MDLGAPKRDRQAERREATRREIIEAAWAVAHEKGLASLTLKDVASRVGMQPPSLYSHFANKNAIYDAMFGEAWAEYEQVDRAATADIESARQRVLAGSLAFFDFAVADLARYQLMNQRTIPGFEPSEESFAPSVRMVQHTVTHLAEAGVTDRGDVEILASIVSGLADQQLANDPGGDSRRKLLERAIGMWADGVGLPRDRTKEKER